MNKSFLTSIRTAAAAAAALTAIAAHGASVMDGAQPAQPVYTLPADASSAPAADAQPAPNNEIDLDRIIAVVNNDIITEHELEQRVHTVAINLRRQNIQLPPMEQLRAQGGADLGTLRLELSGVKDEDWSENWKKYYKPLGPAVYICTTDPNGIFSHMAAFGGEFLCQCASSQLPAAPHDAMRGTFPA